MAAFDKLKDRLEDMERGLTGEQRVRLALSLAAMRAAPTANSGHLKEYVEDISKFVLGE